MPSLENDPGVGPYLNPNYWDGHTLGVGEFNVTPTHQSFADSRFAKDVLQTQLVGDYFEPIHTFGPSEVFNPADYRPGTIVLMRRDDLFGKPVEADYSIDELAAQEVPTRPISTFPSLGYRAPYLGLTDTKRYFTSSVHWGVVPRDNAAGYISETSADGLLTQRAGLKAVMRFMNVPAPIKVGETKHRAAGPLTQESLTRVNVLHVISYGKAVKERKRFLAFVSRPLLTPLAG